MAKVISKLGDDISTDVIYPGRYMATVLPAETPQFAFADDAELNGKLKAKQVPPGSAIVAGKNFGCGSSREQAAFCLKYAGCGAVVAAFVTAAAVSATVLAAQRVQNYTGGSRWPDFAGFAAGRLSVREALARGDGI